MTFDFKNPNYSQVFQERVNVLNWIRADPDIRVPNMRRFYRDNIANFIDDWGTTFDPRNAEIGLPTIVPFRVFDKQREFIDWIIWHWKNRKSGTAEKSREVGVSWLSVATGSSLCLHYDGVVMGYGSRKAEYVDLADGPKSLFYKARMFIRNLPPEFRPGWIEQKHSSYMRISFPATLSYMAGESGDGIGRGDRASIYFVDEEAFLERPLLAKASLSMTTNCCIGISSANGTDNPQYEDRQRRNGTPHLFTFHWRDDPRKDEAWYQAKCEELDNEIIIAQELDINYTASREGIVIPSKWVQAAIDAHIKLGIQVTGERTGAFDVADEGKDKCAFIGGRGILVDVAEEWSGVSSDLFKSTQKAFGFCDDNYITKMRYDADGLGANVRGDARVINETRPQRNLPQIEVTSFRGSGGVFRPEAEDVKGRKNEDYFMNFKAQSWNALRQRFHKTYRAVVENADFNPDDLISLDSGLKNLNKLCAELSQPTWGPNTIGKMVVDKAPDDTKSPNLGDGVMMKFSPFRAPMRINRGALENV